MDNKKHLKIEGYSTSNLYKSPQSGRGGDKFIKHARDRAIHGNLLLQKINAIKDEFEIEEIKNSSLIKDDAIYLEFEDFKIEVDKRKPKMSFKEKYILEFENAKLGIEKCLGEEKN